MLVRTSDDQTLQRAETLRQYARRTPNAPHLFHGVEARMSECSVVGISPADPTATLPLDRCIGYGHKVKTQYIYATTCIPTASFYASGQGKQRLFDVLSISVDKLLDRYGDSILVIDLSTAANANRFGLSGIARAYAIASRCVLLRWSPLLNPIPPMLLEPAFYLLSRFSSTDLVCIAPLPPKPLAHPPQAPCTSTPSPLHIHPSLTTPICVCHRSTPING